MLEVLNELVFAPLNYVLDRTLVADIIWEHIGSKVLPQE